MANTQDLADDDRRVGRIVLAITILIVLVAPVLASTAPDFALRSVAGSNHRLSEHRGEVVALIFWASWCGDCRRELERLRATVSLLRAVERPLAPAGFVEIGRAHV